MSNHHSSQPTALLRVTDVTKEKVLLYLAGHSIILSFGRSSHQRCMKAILRMTRSFASFGSKEKELEPNLIAVSSGKSMHYTPACVLPSSSTLVQFWKDRLPNRRDFNFGNSIHHSSVVMLTLYLQ